MFTKTHREAYPEQYQHSLCGKRVRLPDGREVEVERVTQSRFGQMVHYVGWDPKSAGPERLVFRVEDCEIV